MIDPVTTTLLQYGAVGILALVMFLFVLRLAKRNKELSNEKDKLYQFNIDAQQVMMDKYADLVRETTKVVGGLTGCMKGLATTLDEIKVFIRDERLSRTHIVVHAEDVEVTEPPRHEDESTPASDDSSRSDSPPQS